MLTESIIQEICPLAEQWQFMRELNLLDVETDVLWRPFDTLSEGEQTKVLLAALFLNEGHFLLIDEPTNHLDAKAREKTAEYLNRKKGFILVSHDRTFLDGCVDHILSLNKTNIEVQAGNFSSWMENFKRQQHFELAQNEQLKKDIKRLKESARRTAVWSDKTESGKYGTQSSGLKTDRGFVGHKSAKMMKRAKTIETRQQVQLEKKSNLLKNFETAESLKFFPLTYHADKLITFSDVEIIYNGNTICKPVSFTINQGDRVVLDGKNGSGKSSLLKLINHDPIEHTGKIIMGSNLIISYIPQNTSHLSSSLNDFARENDIDKTLFKTILSKLNFSQAQFEKNISDFSQGQKKKILLAKSLCEQAHLYVWDEPLNYIDLYSRMQIEQVIKDFSPTMIFVEHDSAFRKEISTKVVEIRK